jgi:tetratricopeptide (TPR) repeat protein
VVAERGGRGRVEGIDPPFVGRITELQLLKDVLGAVIQTGRSRLVSIIGEAGIGKSALVWELRKYADGLATEIFWNRGRSLSYGSEGIVYRAISDLLRGRLGVAEDDGTDVVAAALEKTLDRFVADPGEQARIRPWLGSLLGLGDSPEGDRSELDAAVRSFLAHMAGAGPTVLVFDDLHWGDTGLLEFVEQLPDWMPDSPVLVITVARPQLLDRRPTWASGRRGVISLRLGPIPDEFMQRLLEGIMGELDSNLKRDIVDRAAGVPLYAVEFTRALVGAGETFEVEGRTASHTGLEEFGIPETLQLLIGSRIDRLPPDEQMTLLDAAVLGHAFSLAGLAAATDRTEADLRRHLEALVDQELIEPIRDSRSPLRGGYRFVQKLVREVARNRLSREVRRSRHIAIAEFYGAREGPDSAAIAADHYLSALEVTRSDDAANELRLRASGVLLAALDRAAGLYAHEEVLSLGRRMLELELGLDIGTQARIKERMAVAASAQLQPEEAAALAREALDLSTRCGDASGVRRSAALLAFVLLEHIQIDPAIAVLTEQLEGIDDLTVDPELPKLAGLLARAQFLRGDNDDALITADRALVAGEELNLRGTVGDALVTIATVRGVTGRPIEARLMLESVIDFADRHELNAVALRAYLNLGAVIPPSELAGNPTREAIELGRRLGNRNFVLLALGNLANALVFRAQWDELETVLTDPLWEASQGSLLYARRSIDAAASAIRHGVYEGGKIETLAHRPAGDSNMFREFGAQANAALVRLLTGDTDAAIEWANETLARIDEIPWIDATARVMMLVGDPTAVVGLAERVHSRRQTNDDRLGPFLRAAARAHRGEPGGFDEALAQIARLDEDGFVLEQVVRLIGLGRVLDAASPERTAAMEAAGEIVAEHDLNGLAPFLD